MSPGKSSASPPPAPVLVSAPSAKNRWYTQAARTEHNKTVETFVTELEKNSVVQAKLRKSQFVEQDHVRSAADFVGVSRSSTRAMGLANGAGVVLGISGSIFVSEFRADSPSSLAMGIAALVTILCVVVMTAVYSRR